jgi:hypothetical protein
MNAGAEIGKPCAFAINDESVCIRGKAFPRFDIRSHSQCLVDQIIHSARLRVRVFFDEVCRVNGIPLRIRVKTVARAKGIQLLSLALKGLSSLHTAAFRLRDPLTLRPNILMRCDSAHAVKVAVMSGLGIGILHRDHVEQELKRGDLKLLRVRGLKKLHFQSFVVYKALPPLFPVARTFLEFLRQSRALRPQVSRAAKERGSKKPQDASSPGLDHTAAWRNLTAAFEKLNGAPADLYLLLDTANRTRLGSATRNTLRRWSPWLSHWKASKAISAEVKPPGMS